MQVLSGSPLALAAGCSGDDSAEPAAADSPPAQMPDSADAAGVMDMCAMYKTPGVDFRHP